ncbi:MAG: DUF1415 domain-containing protein [Thiotrichales bacterium]|nr:DUF1415 domain-containing protein [Thiotrichales bacterium]
MTSDLSAQHARQAVQTWLETVVIGLNLCPFAKHPWQKAQVHLQVCQATDEETLLQNLAQAIEHLLDESSCAPETTILIVTELLSDFYDYQQFLNWAQALIRRHGWQKKVQIASFHPDYQFAGSDCEDPANLTNRAPYPLLHLLRETSLEKALAHYPHPPETIFQNNMATMHALNAHQKHQYFPYLFEKPLS